MKVVINYDLCESNARCMEVAPEVFQVRSDDRLYILNENPGEEAARQGREGGPRLPQAGDFDR